MEENGLLEPGTYARPNAELVEKIVRISRDLGREVASADEARGICELGQRVVA
jgi:3-keto-5-aminohexanoate cleavage enzyme